MGGIDATVIEAIRSAFPEMVLRYNVEWTKITTFGAGGAAPLIVEPRDDVTLSKFLAFCRERNIGVLPLGAGSNVIGADNPIDKVIVRLRQNDFARVRASHVHVTVGAGTRLYDFLTTCAHLGLGGYAALAGIPATLGGAARQNAGRRGLAVSDFVEEITGFDAEGKPWFASKKEIAWGYRSSSIPRDVIVAAIICKLQKVETLDELRQLAEQTRWGREHYPKERNAGCFFLNPPEGEPAGKLLDECGAKGLSRGFATVSAKHANIIVNRGEATEKDVLELIKELQKLVYERKGVWLKPEIRFANDASAIGLDAPPPKA